MAGKQYFCGTPLAKALHNDQLDFDINESPIKSRLARLNQLQTVRDKQGRQRFHGAFTGGFSAGYYNTVDTIEGFRPRNFVSHRKAGEYHNAPSSSFSHKPEDYMDEEDFGEFGIAPKKIRLNNQFSSVSSQKLDQRLNILTNIFKPSNTSLGEKILRRMCKNSRNVRGKDDQDVLTINFSDDDTKNGYHGLGYKPLLPNNPTQSLKKQHHINPVSAILNDATRISISGEAFGSGVLEDDEDHLDINDAYGYDDVGNYKFKSKTLENDKRAKSKQHSKSIHSDHLRDFVSASEADYLDLYEAIKKKYAIPSIPEDWKMPARKKPDLPNSSATEKVSNYLYQKFTSSSPSIKPPNLESRVGLVSYNDLKDVGTTSLVSSSSVKESFIDSTNNSELSSLIAPVSEEQSSSLQWIRFNKSDPESAVDNSTTHDKSPEPVAENSPKQPSSNDAIHNEHQDQLSDILELKKSTFNITFDEDKEDYCLDSSEINIQTASDSEDEPQVIEVEINQADRNIKEETEMPIDDDPDIVIVAAPKREPEVIILTSSSSSTSSQSQTSDNHDEERQHEAIDQDVDLYGPPLPPTLQTLLDVSHSASSSRQNRVSSHSIVNSRQRKRKRHKRSKKELK